MAVRGARPETGGTTDTGFEQRPGRLGPESVDDLLQWSPDGCRLAMQVREPGGRYDSPQILDAQTLETVLTSRTWLMGSLSWSCDGTRIAVLKYDEPPIMAISVCVLSLVVQGLTLRPLTRLSGVAEPPERARREGGSRRPRARRCGAGTCA